MTVVNKFIKVKNVDEAFLTWYDILSGMGMNQESRDGDVAGEVINAVTEIEDPTRNIMTNTVRKMPIRYAIGEMLWYLSRNRNLPAIQNYSHGWDRMSDDGETVNSNYGYCIFDKFGFDQLSFVEEKLRKDKNSRQAVIHIKEASNKETKDMNCTVCVQFFIRDDKLYATTYMRSNDIWLGFPFDVFQFTCLQCYLAMRLNIGIGTYTHVAGSLHLYKRNANVVNIVDLTNVAGGTSV